MASSDDTHPVSGLQKEGPPRAAVRRPRTANTYVLSCLVFSTTLFILGLLSKENLFDRIAYVVVLFCICAGPFLLGRGNPRHRLVSLFMGSYFLLFGTGGLFRIIDTTATGMIWGGVAKNLTDSSAVTKADFVVILGGLCFLAGYHLTTRARGRKRSNFLANEWRYSSVLVMGFVMWLIGFAFMIGYDLTASVYYIPEYVLGMPTSVATNLKLLSPLGGCMLIYLLTREYRTTLIGTLLVLIIGCEFTLGFIASSKEMSFRIAVLVLLGLYYVKGRVNLKIIGVMVLVSIPYMLYFNAYRMQMMEGGFINGLAAFEKFDSNLDIVKSKTRGNDDVAGSSLRSLSARIDNKVYIDIIVAGTDSGRVSHLYGESLLYFFTSFVPRAIWAGKPVTQIGQKFNWAFGLSSSRYTYVPTTHLGDLYWNFGTPGVIVGMLAIGFIFARMSGTFLDESGMTLARFLCLMMATYYLAVFFSGNIATEYSIFVRLVILIWLLDRLFRKMGVSRPVRKPAQQGPNPEQRLAADKAPPAGGGRPAVGAVVR